MKGKHLYRFGEFALDPEESVLRRENEVVSLTPKMFEMLHVLIRHHGQIVDKETLFREVWPDSFVEEGNISFNIRQLRKLLDDNAQAPIYIETVPRRGYRFIAEVEEIKVSQNGKPPDSIENALGSPPRKRSFLLPVLGIFAVAAFIAAIVWFVRSRDSEKIPLLAAPFSSEKLSTDGAVYHVVLSPDGKNLVYTHRRDGQQSIWLRELDTSDNIQIIPPSDYFYGGLEISPDGKTVYFVRGTQTGPQIDIFKMPISGGVPQKIIEATQGWISISTTGDKISFVRCPYTDEEYCSLYIADSADGKNERKLVSRPRPIRIGDNKISPDGKTIAFGVGQSRTASNDFDLIGVDIETGQERPLTPQRFFNIAYIAWLPGTSDLLLTARTVPDKYSRIWKVDTSSGETSLRTSDSESYSRLSIDEKATMLVSTTIDADFHLDLHRLDDPSAKPRQLADASSVVYAPDGKLIFSSLMAGNSDIWSINPDGSDLRQLTNNPSSEIAPLVSGDGKFIFFNSDRTGKIQCWRMNIDGTDQIPVTSEEGGFPLRISQDGQWLYYRSGLKNSIRRVSVNGGPEEVILNEMGRNMIVSPDTTMLAYTVRKGIETTVTVYSLVEQKPVKTFTISQQSVNLYHLTWSEKGDFLAYILTDDKRENAKLYFQSLDGAAVRQISDLDGDTVAELSAFALSPDGKTFAVVKGNWKHDAVLIKGLGLK